MTAYLFIINDVYKIDYIHETQSPKTLEKIICSKLKNIIQIYIIYVSYITFIPKQLMHMLNNTGEVILFDVRRKITEHAHSHYRYIAASTERTKQLLRSKCLFKIK